MWQRTTTQGLLTLWSVAAVPDSAGGSVIGGLLQGEGADDRLAEELGPADLLLPVLLLGHRLQQLPPRPQFDSYTRYSKKDPLIFITDSWTHGHSLVPTLPTMQLNR